MRKETGKLSEKIRQIQKGNKEEIVEVINQFDPLIKKYQRILYKDAAEDVNAEMVLALWEAVLRIKCIESEAQCAKYLMNALKNKFFGSIVIRDSRFVNEFHILKATCKFCTRLSTFVMTFPFFPLLL